MSPKNKPTFDVIDPTAYEVGIQSIEARRGPDRELTAITVDLVIEPVETDDTDEERRERREIRRDPHAGKQSLLRAHRHSIEYQIIDGEARLSGFRQNHRLESYLAIPAVEDAIAGLPAVKTVGPAEERLGRVLDLASEMGVRSPEVQARRNR